MPDDATVEVLIKWKQDNEYVLREVQANLAALVAQAFQTNLILRSTAAVTTDVQNATQAASAAAAGGMPAWLGIAGAIAAGVIVLYPFVTLVGSAAIALTSFAVAGAGFVAIAALVGGAFAAMGAGVLLLGGGSGAAGAQAALDSATSKLQTAQEALAEFNQAHTGQLTILQQQQKEQLTENIANAQQKYNDALAASQGPMAVLVGQLTDMKNALAAQAAPLAAIITQWAGGFIPVVQQAGQNVMTWFGERLPAVLKGISQVVTNLTPDFANFATHFGNVMDHVGPQIQAIAEAFGHLAFQGLNGLLDNMVRLSDWFVNELPTLGPIVQQIFGQIGGVVQWVAGQRGTLTDFVENKWPTTVKNAQDSLKALQDWWQKNGDTIKTFAQNVVDLMGVFDTLITRWNAVYGFLNGVGLTPTAFLNAINPIISALEYAANLVGYITNPGGGAPTKPGIYAPAGRGPVPAGGSVTNTTHHWHIPATPDPQATARAVVTVMRQAMKV